MSDEKKKPAKKDAPTGAASEEKGAALPLARRDNRAIAVCIAVAVLLTAADLWTKSWAEGALSTERLGDRPEVCAFDEDGFVRYQRLPGETISLVDDVFELEYAENCGAAFGLLRQAPGPVRRVVFGIAAIAATIVLMWLFVQGRGGPYFAASVPLVISGAIGNFFDRSFYGYVVDFIHFHYEHPILWMDRFDYPTFNVADIAITVGVVLLLIDGMRTETPKTAEAAAKPSAPLHPLPSTGEGGVRADEPGPVDEGEDDGESETESDPKAESESDPKAESETSAR